MMISLFTVLCENRIVGSRYDFNSLKEFYKYPCQIPASISISYSEVGPFTDEWIILNCLDLDHSGETVDCLD